MSEEERADLPLGPVVDGVGEGVHAQGVPPDEVAAEVDPRETVLERVQARDVALKKGIFKMPVFYKSVVASKWLNKIDDADVDEVDWLID